MNADVKELQERLAAARQELRAERTERERAAAQLEALRGRWSVRVALGVADAARPVRLLPRRLGRRLIPRLRRQPTPLSAPPRTDVRDGGNPFFAQLASLFGEQPTERLWPIPAAGSAAALQDSALMDGPRVSVVMVVSDGAVAVERSVQSLLQQTYRQWELIVRDCTGGAGGEWANEVGDRRVSVVRLRSTNHGVARNHGLAAAGGGLIAYLDPPNLWHPRFLETLVAALLRDRAHYAVYCDHLDATVTGPRGEPRRRGDAHGDYADLVEQRAITLNAVVHRRELYDELGGASKNSSIGHDQDLLLKYTFLRDPLRLDECLLLQPQTGTEGGGAASGPDRPSAPRLRTLVERHLHRRLSQAPQGRRPGLTVVGGVGQLAHEKAWDVAAVAGEMTPTQLVDLRFGNGPAYAPRFLPSPETELIRLEGGRFPAWVAMLAKGVANVHGDVVYAAEPRLPSLGIALLASYHHGIPVMVDVSHPRPVENGDAGESRSTEPDGPVRPVSLEDVDPSDAALLDPHSPLWDRLMAGFAYALPSRLAGSLTTAGQTASKPLVLDHPKNEAVFDPSAHDHELAKGRLGLDLNERVVLCGGYDTVSWGLGGRVEVLDTLAAQFHLLTLATRQAAHHPVEDRLQGVPMVVDRNDEDAVAAAMAASDALLLWVDPHSPSVRCGLPPELGSALAMELPVIANDLGELGALGRGGYLRLVPFGDVDGLGRCLEGPLRDEHQRRAQVAAGRHLFMRQFSHAAASVNIGAILRMVERDGAAPRVAEEFAEFFSAFYRRLRTEEASR